MTLPPRKRRARALPLEAHDARLFDLWRRGALEVIVLGSVPPQTIRDEAYLAETGRLAKLNQILNSARSTAKREQMPGWEDLYRAVLRQRRDSNGRIYELRLEPRGNELDTLLGEVVGPAAPGPAPAQSPSAEPVPFDDILADVFGRPEGEK